MSGVKDKSKSLTLFNPSETLVNFLFKIMA